MSDTRSSTDEEDVLVVLHLAITSVRSLHADGELGRLARESFEVLGDGSGDSTTNAENEEHLMGVLLLGSVELGRNVGDGKGVTLTERHAGEGKVGMLTGSPVTLEGYTKDDGAVNEGGVRLAEGGAKVEAREEVDREELEEPGGTLECPDGDGCPDPGAESGDVVEESDEDEDGP